MRKTDAAFIDRVRDAVGESGLPLTPPALDAIALPYSKVSRWKTSTKAKWIASKLQQPDIRAALADVFGEYGMSHDYLLKKQREHIEAGNYAALKDVLAMVLPKAPSRHQVQSVNVHVDAPPQREGPPGMSSRLLGSALVAARRDD